MYINVRQKTKSNVAKSSDKGSLKFLYIFLQIGTLLSFSIGATKIGKIDYQYTFIVLGIILVLIGLIIRIKSILTLKQQYTYTVTIVENHQLVETGLYKYIRHPGYLGLLIICLGISTALSNWLAILFMII